MVSARALAMALVASALGLGLAPAEAVADDNDLVLSRFGTQVLEGGQVVDIIGHNQEFRSFASELGVAIAPRVLHGADTLGYGGFEFTTDVGTTSISGTKSFWRVREGSEEPTGGDGVRHAPDQLRTVGVFARKGLWFPAPGAEVGLGAVHITDSGMYAGQAYIRLALYEGFPSSPMPSLGLRVAGARLFGARDLDLTTAAIDLNISKPIGVAGTFRVDPYFNYGLLFIVPRSQVLDGTPNIDPLDPGQDADNNLNFVLRDQNTITRQRAQFGARFEYARISATAALDYVPGGKSKDNAAGTSETCEVVPTTADCDSTDASGSQVSVFFSVGLAL